VQQTYTIRFRDDEQILKLFTSETDKPEIINMNRLFNTRKVVWENNQYNEVADDIEDDAGTGQHNILCKHTNKTDIDGDDDEFDPYDEQNNTIFMNKNTNKTNTDDDEL
jgi:hypothetical protein